MRSRFSVELVQNLFAIRRVNVHHIHIQKGASVGVLLCHHMLRSMLTIHL